jgi:phosphoglycolate phosphatase
MASEKHILWDWNGTLLNDTQAALDTLNIMLRRRGAPEIEMEFYRDNFAFPVKPFYSSIGMALENEDWDKLAEEYHDIYAVQPKSLNSRALEALSLVRDAGSRQSIISALRQDLLDAATGRYGVSGFMEHIYGVDNLDGSSKIDRARLLLSAIRRESDDEIVIIGDSLHDFEVARELGVRCVLCSQGSHAGWRLAKVAPTGETLAEAARMALEV